MNDRRLIQLVKSYDELYDQSHKKYANFFRKAYIWRKIAVELKQQPNACKTRWNNIRDLFKKLLRKRSTNPEANYKRYKYESQLAFLIPFLQVKSNRDAVLEGSNSQLEEENCTTFIDINTSIPSDESGEPPTYSAQRERRKSAALNQRIRKTTSSSPMKLLLEEEEHGKLACRLPSVDAFLAGIAPTLKALSPIRLNLTKSKIFALVQEQEMAMFLEQQNKTMRRISMYEAREASSQSRSCVSEALSPSTSTHSRSPSPIIIDFQPMDGYTVKSEIGEKLHFDSTQ